MPGRRPLKAGAPRLLGNHGGVEGHAYRRAFAALAEQFGPFLSEVVRFEAGRVAVARMQLERATMELTKAQRDRRCGKGRRPNLQQIERLARRQGLADQTYASRLEELAQQQSEQDPLDELLRR